MKKKILSTFYKQISIPNEVQILNNKKDNLIIQGSLGWVDLPLNISRFVPSVGQKNSLIKDKNNFLIKNQNIDNFCRYNSKINKLCFLFPYLTFSNKQKVNDILWGTEGLKESSYLKANFGNLKTQIQNQIKGVQEAFVITLKLNGLGYKAFLTFLNQKNKKRNLPRNFDFNLLDKNEIPLGLSRTQCLVLDLGFSHLVSYKLPSEILLFIPKPDIISIYGLDKSLVSQVASEIKDIKCPESFTGKGIFYIDKIVKIKLGKKT